MAASDLINLSGLIDDAKCLTLVREHRWPQGARQVDAPRVRERRHVWDGAGMPFGHTVDPLLQPAQVSGMVCSTTWFSAGASGDVSTMRNRSASPCPA